MVRRQHDHHVPAVPLHRQCGQGYRGCGVPADRLTDEVARGELGRLLGDETEVTLLGNNDHVARIDQWLDTPESELEHALLAEERQERLGARSATQRPQPGTRAASQDNRIHRGDSMAAPDSR